MDGGVHRYAGHGPGDVVQGRALPGGRTAARSTGGHAVLLGSEPGAVGQVGTGQRPGDGTSLSGTGRPGALSGTDPVCRAGVAAHVCASLEGPRAA